MTGLLYLGGANPVACSMDIARDLLTQARARGIRSHVTNRAETLPHTRQAHRLADQVSAVDPDDPAGCVRWARERLAAGERFDVVLGLRDTVQLSVARTAAALGAPGNPPEAVRRVRDKDVCRQALAAAGFRQPMVRLCTSARQAVAVLRESAGPWVIKPRAGQGSQGVRMVTG
ncbi:MAG TPA: hypothetical protein VFT95_03570, partial [Micromonosporaceae bacterium]|nr:hypothetical protein [Micromonosporaceae bacterium]